MSFIADKQTVEDLNLLGKFKSNSIYSLFNKVNTMGGERLLENMFQKPLTDHNSINKRTAVFKYFHSLQIEFPFRKQTFSVVENYLSTFAAVNFPANFVGLFRKKTMSSFLRDEGFNNTLSGVMATIDMLRLLIRLVEKINIDIVDSAKEILSDKRLQAMINEDAGSALSFFKLAYYDYLLRSKMRKEMDVLQDTIYKLDVHIAVSKVAADNDFQYATAFPANENIFETRALWHPAINKPVANGLNLNGNFNMLFLTGANMAGKSTLMKSFGIAVYLAHMGFPVAAHDLRFSVRDGIYSSINVPDNLNMGYSHFYAEVLRVKQAAETIGSGKNMVVIFDELFKGTNVKDAYDATLSVSAAFAKYRNCCFIISTHIIEVADELGKQCENITFSYLPTIMEGDKPRYTYRLSEGVTNDRQGMTIIRNEGIIEMIIRSKNAPAAL